MRAVPSRSQTVHTGLYERDLLWYSTVFSSADRESAYVIDGLMHFAFHRIEDRSPPSPYPPRIMNRLPKSDDDLEPRMAANLGKNICKNRL
jgi:hypothetical protein